jgi:hypothetical protein
VSAVATVTGHYRDADVDAQWLGGEAVIAERLARGRAAREKYEATGEIDYVPAVDAESTDVGTPGAAALELVPALGRPRAMGEPIRAVERRSSALL